MSISEMEAFRLPCSCKAVEKKRKRKEETMPFSVNSMRSQVLHCPAAAGLYNSS